MVVLAESAARKLLHGAAARVVAAAAAVGMSFGLDGLWQLIADIFASLIHLFVLPFHALAASIGYGFEALGHAIQGFFAGIVPGLGRAAYLIVLPFEMLWLWLQASVAGILVGIGSAAHLFVLPFEAFWRWLRAAAAAALPYVLVIIAVVCVVALVWLSCTFLCSVAALVVTPLAGAVISCWLFLFPATVKIGQALVYAVSYTSKGVGMVLGWVVPNRGRCCVLVTMKAPGAAGMEISRGAFESLPQLYFLILRSARAVVAAAVFCARPVAWACGGPVAALFRAL